MLKFIRIGVDLAKNFFQVHALETDDGRAVTKKLSRSKVLGFFKSVEPCLVGMEACGSAHYWARELTSMGHQVYLIPPSYIKAYVKRGKNDAVDAEAICEAMSRPGMRFVPIKTKDQQAVLMLHKSRDLLIKQRTMSTNALRSHLLEFGVITAQGANRIDGLIEMARSDHDVPEMAKELIDILAQQLDEIDAAIVAVDKKIAAVCANDARMRLLDLVPGVGKIIASVVAASVPEPAIFNSGRDFAAWLGLTPRQNSSGGKAKLGKITKKGNRYIRKLLVLSSTSLLRSVAKRTGALRDWIAALLLKKPARLVTVAIANKLARIMWAMLNTGEGFREEIFMKA